MKNIFVSELFVTGKTGIATYIVENFPDKDKVGAAELFNHVVKSIYNNATQSIITIESVIAEHIIENDLLTSSDLLFTGLLSEKLKIKLVIKYPCYRNFVDLENISDESFALLVDSGQGFRINVDEVEPPTDQSFANCASFISPLFFSSIRAGKDSGGASASDPQDNEEPIENKVKRFMDGLQNPAHQLSIQQFEGDFFTNILEAINLKVEPTTKY